VCSMARPASPPICRCAYQPRWGPTQRFGMNCRPTTICGKHRRKSGQRSSLSIGRLRPRSDTVSGKCRNHASTFFIPIAWARSNANGELRRVPTGHESGIRPLSPDFVRWGGLHPGLFSSLPSGKGAVPSPLKAEDGSVSCKKIFSYAYLFCVLQSVTL